MLPSVSAPLIAAGRITHFRNLMVEQGIVIVTDRAFLYLARNAVPVHPHIRIDPDTKTVATGAPWYEESLPPDTVLYCGLITSASRKENHARSAEALITALERSLTRTDESEASAASYLRVGGNETTGMGWCLLAWHGREV